MNKNLQMINRKNNFFSKLFIKIRSFFIRNKIVESDLINDNEINTKSADNNLKDSLKISESYKELLNLQNAIENDEISIADISEETAEELIKLYTQQNI